MSGNGFCITLFKYCQIALVLALSSIVFENASFGQTGSQLAPPAPLGTPDVLTGPLANPFGPPPMAIGPAPQPQPYVLRAPYAYDVFGRPLLPPPAYAVSAYPPNPYWVRRPTPFEGTAQQFPVTQVPDSRNLLGQRQPIPSESVPAPTGNLQLTVSERFLNRLIARDEHKPGEVRDFILGAQVTGKQMTATTLKIDLLPGPDKIRGVLVLNGTTQSQTTGVTPQAMVDVASQQQFVATKEVYFDGMNFTTRHAVVHVQAKNQTLGAVTPLSGTLFGGIADRIAYREAQRRQPEAEAVARDRVAERVYPEFDSTVDKQLALANDQLEGTVRRMLRLANLMPSQQQAWSTNRSIGYSAQIGTESPTLPSTGLECDIGNDEGACLKINESLLNSLVARSGLRGLKTTDKQIRSFFSSYEVKPTSEEQENAENSDQPIGIPGLANITTDIEFDKDDPLTIQIGEDRTMITLRASFKPAGQTMMPPLAVKIEYRTEMVGDKILVIPGKANVTKLDSDDSDSAPDITMKIMAQAIESNLTKLAFDRSLPASLWSLGGQVPRVVSIRSRDGWAAISID